MYSAAAAARQLANAGSLPADVAAAVQRAQQVALEVGARASQAAWDPQRGGFWEKGHDGRPETFTGCRRAMAKPWWPQVGARVSGEQPLCVEHGCSDVFALPCCCSAAMPRTERSALCARLPLFLPRTQLEGMLGSFWLWQATGDGIHLHRMLGALSVLQQRFADPAGGEFFAYVDDSSGQPACGTQKADEWKANYHSLRGLLYAAEWLAAARRGQATVPKI